jgi:uncharacterized protein YecA (UPF0149 family)
MIKRDHKGRIYDNAESETYGKFVRKLGGYSAYHNWIHSHPQIFNYSIKDQGRNEKCDCESGLKYKKCCLIK